MGMLPAAWGNMTRLQSLSLSYNASAPHPSSTLSLPSSWSGLSSLQRMSVSNWKLDGGLPSLWSSMMSLRDLRFRNVTFCCSLNYTVPMTWGSLSNLYTFLLDDVRGLTGTLPSVWYTGSSTLQVLHLRAVPGLTVSWSNVTSLLFSAAPPMTGRLLRSLTLDGLNLTGSMVPAASSG
jgi:hypothetical protein